MLLPNKLAKMKLGLKEGWKRPQLVGVSDENPPPEAYSRIMSAPRVQGHNDLIGDCFPTACCNAVQTLLARAGSTTQIPDDAATLAYSGMTGYTPQNALSDQGTDPSVGFNWWLNNPICGFKLKSVIDIDPKNLTSMRKTTILSGGVLLCVNLALEQQNQIVWTASGRAGTWGGHAIWMDSFEGPYDFVTSWGEERGIDRSFFDGNFVTAAYGLGLEYVGG